MTAMEMLNAEFVALFSLHKAARYKPGERRTRRDGSVWEGRAGAPAEMVIPPPPRKKRKVAAVEDDEGQKPHHYTLLGIYDDVNECDLCGKADLKCTMALQTHDADGNDTGEVYYGRDCGSRALGWTAGPARAEKIIKGEARLTYKELRGSSPEATAALPKTNYGNGLHYRRMAGTLPKDGASTFPGTVDGAPILVRIAEHDTEFDALKGEGWTQSAYPLVWRFDASRATTRENGYEEPVASQPSPEPDSQQLVDSVVGRSVRHWGHPATIVRWEPFSAGMTDTVIRDTATGREISVVMSQLVREDGPELPTRHQVNLMRQREMAKQLERINDRLMEDAYKPWPGMEFGKGILSRSIRAARGEKLEPLPTMTRRKKRSPR